MEFIIKAILLLGYAVAFHHEASQWVSQQVGKFEFMGHSCTHGDDLRPAVAAKLRSSIDGEITAVIAVWSDASPLGEDWKWHGWMGRLH